MQKTDNKTIKTKQSISTQITKETQNMKKFFLFSMLLGALPMALLAQDDLYFNPTKDKEHFERPKREIHERPTYYGGINKTDDEYNRRRGLHSRYEKIGKDSLGNDIIMFDSFDPSFNETFDTLYISDYRDGDFYDDFAFARRRHHLRGYWGYYGGWGSWDPWYDGFYSPYYYGYAGYYYPYSRWYGYWNYGFYGRWGWPYYYGGYGYPYYGGWAYWPRTVYYSGHTGTGNHWGSARQGSVGSFSGNRNGFAPSRSTTNRGSFGNMRMRDNGQFSGSRQNTTTRSDAFRYNNTNNSRSTTPQRTYNQNSFGNGSRSMNSGNFGGSRGGGGSFGGSRSGGGFGGRR